MTRRESRTVIIFWLTATLLVIAGVAGAWTVEDCIEVNWDHPDCDQYPTTTVYVTTTQPEVTTTTAEVTTTTAQETTTTVAETTTTTIPFDSVPTTLAPEIGDPLTVESTLAPPLEELPETGISTTYLALASSVLLTGGLIVLGFRSRKVEG